MRSLPVWTAVALCGCDAPWQRMAPDRVCDDVAYAISARTFECLDDEALAARRFDELQRAWECRVDGLDEPIDRYYHCPVAVNALTCAEVEDAGDDLAVWLEASWTCEVILTPADPP